MKSLKKISLSRVNMQHSHSIKFPSAIPSAEYHYPDITTTTRVVKSRLQGLQENATLPLSLYDTGSIDC